MTLYANYFQFQLAQNSMLYQYAVDFEPALEASNIRQRLVYARKELDVVACDGQLLFSPKKIPDQHWTATTAGGSVEVMIKLVKELRPSDGVPYQLCNVLMKRLFRSLKMVMMGRNYYTPERKVQFPQYSIELWPGCIASVSPVQNGIALICDVSHKTIRLDSVLTSITQIQSNTRGGNWKAAVEAELVKGIVLTRYNNCTYRIDKIDWGMTPASTFDWDGHGQTSFAEYLLRVYDKKVTNMQQPLLVATCRKRQIHLIPEFCFRTGLSDEMKKDFRLMSDLAQHTRPDPGARVKEVTGLVNKLVGDAECKKQLDRWGVTIVPQITQCVGSIVDVPRIVFSAGMTVPGITEYRGEKKADWTFSLTKGKVVSAIPTSNWIVLFPQDCGNDAKFFVERLLPTARSAGINFAPPTPVPVGGSSFDQYVQTLRAAVNQKKPQFVLCVLRQDAKELYNGLKRVCSHEVPVPSQIVKTRTIGNKRLDAILLKIVLQMNCKLGGELWTLQYPPETNNTMLIGIDVCHATPIGSSVSGLVATMNGTFSKYFSAVTFQERGKEIIEGISAFVSKAISEYKKKNNGQTPKQVIVFRDGVGDGQLEFVLREEVPQYRQGFDDADKLSTPKLMVVVVKKRIHTRIFSATGPNTLGNPFPGTVVDNKIMHPGWYDFFLVSQSVTQGTVTPTHYHVIEDQIGMRAPVLQQFTHQLTHLYYNWSGTIRVPAPCQYAHKLAFLVGQNIQRPPHDALSDKLYFL